MQATIGAGREMTSVRTYLRRIAWFLAGIMVAVGSYAPPARSQTLAPTAQDAMEHGLAAAQQQDYKLAYRYFLDAQKADPGSAAIRFNLGLAAAKIPGHEFRAIAWLKSYLLANPNAGNAGAIRAQITNLEVAFEQRLGKVVDALEPVTKAIADADYANLEGTDGRYESRLTDGGLLAAMRFYLGDINGGQKTRQHFGIGKGNVHRRMSSMIYGHFDRGLASVGLYDELISEDWLSEDSGLGNPAQAPDGALFAIERGDFDAADRMYQRGASNSSRPIRRSIVCKFVELGRIDEALKSADGLFSKEDEKDFGASREKWFDANCSGWWLKKGELDRLVARGRDGQAIAVWKGDFQVQGLVARVDETSMDKYLLNLKKFVAIKAKVHPSGSDVEGALDSLADLLESYRQMHGPYGR